MSKKFSFIQKQKVRGFVLPFTLFLVAIMITVTTNISSILTHQIYFSRVARQSQAAYYAADDALACAISLDDTYVNGATTQGVFPWDTHTSNVHSNSLDIAAINQDMRDTLADYNITYRAANSLPSLTFANGSATDIRCAQNAVFAPSPAVTDFLISPQSATVTVSGSNEEAVVSSFKMKMPINATDYRCAKVTVIKSATYRQIIAQGYALCDRPTGSVERAVVDTAVH
jgi:type II secretory pathway pseudopilin PulG